MTRIHDRHARGHTQTGWLDARHTFSFGEFRDPARTRFRKLRVLSEDRVVPGAGFGMHPHQNMEIITYIISGELSHEDSLGNGSVIRPGQIQRMSAGSGIMHAENNTSETEPTHLYQIWIHPDKLNLEPSYEQIDLSPETGVDGFSVIAGPDGGDGAVTIHQDARLLMARPEDGDNLDLSLPADRYGFLQVVKGQVSVDGETLNAGDGFEFDGGDNHALLAQTDAELLLFDMA